MTTEAKLTKHGFTKCSIGDWSILYRSEDLEQDFLELCCQEDKASSDNFSAVTCGKDSDVYRFEWSNRVFFFKEFLCRGVGDRVKSLFRDSRAVRALQGEFIITDAGLRTPTILAIGENGIRNFMVTEEVPDAMGLQFMVRDPSKYPIPSHRFAERVGSIVGKLHARHVCHGDLRWGNILMTSDGNDLQFFFIDNERTVQYEVLPEKARLKNLVQMAMAADKLNNYLALRFWIAYMKENPELMPDQRRLLKAVLEITGKRQKKRAYGGYH